MRKKFVFVQYLKEMNLPDGLYHSKYNDEPAITRLKDGVPVWVQLIGFMKHYDGEYKRCDSCIYDPRGIMHSNVELLLPAQEFNLVPQST